MHYRGLINYVFAVQSKIGCTEGASEDAQLQIVHEERS